MKLKEFPAIIQSDASFSTDMRYRYTLHRIWQSEKPLIMFIGLNPSTAGATEDDPTINRLKNFAFDHGYGGFYMVNLFAFRATEPTDMFNADDPVGDLNDAAILAVANIVKDVAFCWGVNGYYKDRDMDMMPVFKNALCFGETINGYPKHPLYLHSDTKLRLFSYRPKRAII